MSKEKKGGASAPPASAVVIDSTDMRLPRAGTVHITPEWIDATLRQHFERGHNGGIDLPDPTIWVVLAARINMFIDQPWSNHSAAHVAQAARRQQEDRRILNAAARILERDRDRFPPVPGFDEWRTRWDSAIAVLRSPRGASDYPEHQLSRSVSPQQSSRAWAYTARELIPDLVVFSVQSRADVKATAGNGIMKTIRDILQRIYPTEKLPSMPGLCKALKDDIEKYVKIAKTNP